MAPRSGDEPFCRHAQRWPGFSLAQKEQNKTRYFKYSLPPSCPFHIMDKPAASWGQITPSGFSSEAATLAISGDAACLGCRSCCPPGCLPAWGGSRSARPALASEVPGQDLGPASLLGHCLPPPPSLCPLGILRETRFNLFLLAHCLLISPRNLLV